MFNPIKASNTIRESFVDYITTSYSFANSELQKQFKEELNKNVSKGPLLEIHDVFSSGKSINQLIEEGILSPLFRDLEKNKPNNSLYKKKLPIDRPLYKHQEMAIRAIVNGNNTVISTGTGSGKTNCFLIPVLNELLKEKENGKLDNGVRAMFIYPMNALANDQLKNIREILMYYPDITFGVYNGATENNDDKALKVYEAMFQNEDIPELRTKLENEILSRDEMKKCPPNILFTNYAMLEHLLLRPKDAILFRGSNFKFVVLDEAHIYTGATGIETSLLLSRLRARLEAKDTQFILTSATLGTSKDSDDNIITFAQSLCGGIFKKENIIRGTREKFIPYSNQIEYDENLFIDLADEKNIIKNILNNYSIKYDYNNSDEEILYDILIKSTIYNKMRLLKSDKDIYDVTNLAKNLNVKDETAISFVTLCTKAQKNGKSLLDARYHFFIRSLEGCFSTIGLKPKLFLSRQKEYLNKDTNKIQTVFEISICNDCGKIAFVGKVEDSKLKQSSKINENVDYFYECNSQEKDEIINDDDLILDNKNNDEYFYLCPTCGSIFPYNQINNFPCNCGKYILVKKAKKLEYGSRCGNCHTGYFRRVYLGNDAATSVLATSLYETLPETTYVKENNENTQNTNSIFKQSLCSSRKKEIRKGRQFLAFSDSRQEAAKFSCYLDKSYKEFLRRRGVFQVITEEIENNGSSWINFQDLINKLKNKFQINNSFAESNNDLNGCSLTVCSENAWVALINELYRFNSPTSLTSLGVLQFDFLGNDETIIQGIMEFANVSREIAKNVANMLVFELVKTGALSPIEKEVINSDDREYLFYSKRQRYVDKNPSDDSIETKRWCPKAKNNNSKYYMTTKMYHLVKTIGLSNENAYKLLDEYFNYITNPNNKFHIEDSKTGKGYTIPPEYFKVMFYNNKNAHWYKCKQCGKVTTININNVCPSIRCNGTIEEVNPQDLFKNNHFANLYSIKRMSPLLIKEHTAQLDKKESAEYQEKFIKKEINALSCSTTFEMGVDVGDLETVFLRDIPPLPSNYAQRAGRAGRSINAAAFALTFAKLSSHDLSFFKNPREMIKGSIEPPLFKIDNEKIVRRHIYAVALSMFFALNPDMYNHNNAKEFINNKGYSKFINWLEDKPKELKSLLEESIPNIDSLHERVGINDFSWTKGLYGEDGVFKKLIDEYEYNVSEFEKQIKQNKEKNNFKEADKLSTKLSIYQSNRLIDFLARGNILPRYGFPVDTVELQLHPNINNSPSLCLSRDLQIAISEYAPSSEIIADGRLYTSRYIKKIVSTDGTKDWDTAYLAICPNDDCQSLNYSKFLPDTDQKCISCQCDIPPMKFYESIEPRAGFITENESYNVPMTSQEKNYRSQDFYIGDENAKIISKKDFRFNDITVYVESSTNDSLLIKSSSTFFVCPVCGYAITSEEAIKKCKSKVNENSQYVILENTHPRNTSGICSNKKLVRYLIHHKFNTDVAKITFDCDTTNYNTMLSTMYAILNAVSEYLNIERRDIKACLSPRYNKELKICNYSIIIYDSVPGGAGHSRRLVGKEVLHNILLKAMRNMEECTCDPSCYNCLRSYENQRIHDQLDRKLAYNFLKQFE